MKRTDFSELASQRFNRMKGKSLTDETRSRKQSTLAAEFDLSSSPVISAPPDLMHVADKTKQVN